MDGNFWVFGYGSLMWRPGFDYQERRAATLHGWHRAMCVLSTHYRGCPDKPGLVLGLDRGGSCRGVAFRIAADKSEEVRQYLYDREMITGVYTPRFSPARLDDGRGVPVFIFPVRKDHEQYSGRLTINEAARLIRQGHGMAGSSLDYLAQTVAQMTEIGITRSELHRLLRLVEQNAP
ncbi:MAG TPA: gamma-glutamylcyclotransferase [Candidatus Sulfotelmatobacter sp.]|nr:gamma-glutamylcyclotransferase [Candidatus Sulfotelmatobacter sp.]